MTALAELTAGTHADVFRARITHPELDGPLELTIDPDTRPELTLSETNAPAVTVSLSVPLTDELAAAIAAQALDPRTGARLELEAGYQTPDADDGAETVWSFDLGLRRATPRWAGRRLELVADGDESLMDDASAALGETVTAATTTAAMVALIGTALRPPPRVLVTAPAGPAVTLEPITDRLEALKDLADRIGARVYDRGDRTWTIEPVAELDTPALALTCGAGGTTLEAEPGVNRDEWHNYVMVSYRWRDTAGVEQLVRATAMATSGPYSSTGPAGRRILPLERDTPTTQTNANAVAAALLRRELSRGESWTLRAIAAWWLRPGDTFTAVLPDGTTRELIVATVTFHADDATMTVAGRLPAAELPVIETTTPPAAPAEPDPPPPAVPPATKTYTSTWVSNSSDAYRENGSKRTDSPDLFQGEFSGSFNGNQRSVILFTGANSTGDETGKTISQALAGALGITRVRVRVYFRHWWYPTSGTARFGFAKLTAQPVTFSGGAPYVTSTGWPEKSSRWVTITSPKLVAALLAGSCRAITLGPGPANDARSYGYAAPHDAGTASHRPVLEITYRR